jgi:uncharacterized membrane protein YhaH (DUF805 family)
MFEAFSKYSDFSGRAGRSEFWLFQLLNVLVLAFSFGILIAGAGGASLEDYGRASAASTSFLFGAALLGFWLLISFIPNLAVTVRRFHDHNISGWWYLGLFVVSFIPYIGWLASLAMLWVFVRGGTWGPNSYGPDPVNPWRNNPTFA